jgi:hypothetical protein
MNRGTPLTNAEDESARSLLAGPLPRMLPPVVLLSRCPQMGGQAGGNLSRLDVKLAIEIVMGRGAPVWFDTSGLAETGQTSPA